MRLNGDASNLRFELDMNIYLLLALIKFLIITCDLSF